MNEKAKFKLSAVAPKGQLAFSNMPASMTNRADGTQLYSFQQTPIMSSYLLFLGMGDMERKTVMAGKTEIGVITRKGVRYELSHCVSGTVVRCWTKSSRRRLHASST